MRDEPELLVPISQRPAKPPAPNWRLSLLRFWCVLGVIVAGVVLAGDSRGVNLRGAIYTLAGFYAVWQVAAWIFPSMPSRTNRDQ